MEIATMVLSLVLGSVGGILVAGPIARRGSIAQKRHEAELRISGSLQGYRNQLKHQHDQLFTLDHFPEGYASWHAQEQLAETILSDLRYLPTRQQRRARQLLQQLVGMTTIRLTEERLHVPVEGRSELSEKDRVALALREGGDLVEVGLLRQLKRTENDPDAHEPIFNRALKVLDELIALVGTTTRDARWRGWVRSRRS